MKKFFIIPACLLILTGCNWWGTSEKEKQADDPIIALSKDIAEMKQMLSDMGKKQATKPICSPKKETPPAIIADKGKRYEPHVKLADINASTKKAVYDVYCKNGAIKKLYMTEGERAFFEDGGKKYALDLISVRKTGQCRSEAIKTITEMGE